MLAKICINRKTSVSVLQLFLNIFILVISQGYERVYHLNHVRDLGLALFTGYRLLRQSTVSKLISALSGMSEFKDVWSRSIGSAAKTLPHLKCGISIDEHVIPHWGKQDIGKCRVPTRGKVMRAVKVFVAFILKSRQHLCFDVTKGSKVLSVKIVGIVNEISDYMGHDQELVIIADKGSYSGKNFADLNSLPKIHYILPAKNTSGNKKQWDAIESGLYMNYKDPRNNLEYKLTITKTCIKDCPELLRTILLKDDKGKYTAFFTNFKSNPTKDVLDYYRTHWRQETSYRILKNDLGFDYLPHPTKKTDDGETILNENSLEFTSWLKLYCANILEKFSMTIGGKWEHNYASTLIRQIIAQPGVIELYSNRIEIKLENEQDERVALYIGKINNSNISVPWLGDKKLTINISKNYLKKRQNMFLY